MRRICKKAVSMIMVLVLLTSGFILNGCAGKKSGDEPIQLTVYSQLASYSGKLTGWFAQIMKEKYNVEMTIIPDFDGSYETRMEEGDLGDIVVFGNDGNDYQQAVKEGMLYDWNDEDLLTNYGAYIKDNMTYALDKNRELTETIYKNQGISDEPAIFGIGNNVATSSKDHESFFYTWDLRWDLYTQLGFPEIKNLEDYYNLMVAMKELCPTDENGEETYAVSLFPDWDDNMVMYIKAFATAYWGYDELGLGLYDVENGSFHYALEEDGPYLQSLAFFNKLFRAGLVDPDSMAQTCTEAGEKVQNGGTFSSIFSFCGSSVYNTQAHIDNNQMMLALTPEDATPICYGMNVAGANRIWAIGSDTAYPELCMEIINYLATPEGYMTYNYGPMADGADDEDGCWYIGEDGLSYFTELGKEIFTDRDTQMPESAGGGKFSDGVCAINNTTWSYDATNPLTGGVERYNASSWLSQQVRANCQVEQDWRNLTGCTTTEEYMNGLKYKVAIATNYTESTKSDELSVTWNQVSNCIKTYTWKAIYAKTEKEYQSIVKEMVAQCKEYDPDGTCLAWCENEASIKNALEQQYK